MAAQLHHHPNGLFVAQDVVQVLPNHRLKIKLVCRVEIRGNRLRVAIHHDGFVAALLGRQNPVHAGVVKFNALANAVGTGAQHHHLGAV